MATSKKRVQISKSERLELIRKFLIDGVPEWKIRKKLVDGVFVGRTKIAKVSSDTARSDLKQIGLAYKALYDNPLVVERVVGACAERLARIADKAEANNNFNAAIRANLALVDIVARRTNRWAHKGHSLEDELVVTQEKKTPYDNMSDDELIEELERKRQRTASLKLVRGGK